MLTENISILTVTRMVLDIQWPFSYWHLNAGNTKKVRCAFNTGGVLVRVQPVQGPCVSGALSSTILRWGDNSRSENGNRPLANQGHTSNWRCQFDNNFFCWKGNSIILFQNWIESKSDEIIAMSIHFNNFPILAWIRCLDLPSFHRGDLLMG